MAEMIQNIDGQIMLYIQENIRCGFLNAIMIFFTTIGNSGIIWIVIGALMLIPKKYREAGFDILLAMAVCYILNDIIIKNIVCRERPYTAIQELTTIVPQLSSYSFPSGHACSSFAFAAVFTKIFGRKGAFIYIPATLVALSRPYVGVHYMTDVIVGMAVGTVGSLAVFTIRRRYFRFGARTGQKNHDKG